MRILALVPGGIDNQLLFFPTLETLKQQYPQAAIDVLVEPRSKKSYRVCKNVDEVLVFDFQDRNSFADYLNLLGIMRDREYDAVVSLKTTWRIKLLCGLTVYPPELVMKMIHQFIYLHPYLANPNNMWLKCITIWWQALASKRLVLR